MRIHACPHHVQLEDGLTALHLAVIRGHEGVATALLQGRADVDAASSAGDTPLMWAAHQGRDSICHLLLSWGADATLKNAAQQNAAMQASYQGFRHIKTLLDHHDAWKAKGEAATTPGLASAPAAAAAARRAANLAEVAQSLREEAERKEDDAFWASVRARREQASGDEELFRDFVSTSAKGPSSSGTFQAPRRKEPGHLRGPYRILDLGPAASAADVRKAYRKLALLHHPDKNPGDPDGAKKRFTKVALAYEAICAHLAPPVSSH
ncbi:unnamed protein product [Symbiodinium sp. KB8]|nr:unnamed protein product [Symbiodinium sp. KB8]